jgi:hypothetical protein
MFVVVDKNTGKYRSGKYGFSSELSKAKVYTRKCDAASAAKFRIPGDTEVIEVHIVMGPDPAIAAAAVAKAAAKLAAKAALKKVATDLTASAPPVYLVYDPGKV